MEPKKIDLNNISEINKFIEREIFPYARVYEYRRQEFQRKTRQRIAKLIACSTLLFFILNAYIRDMLFALVFVFILTTIIYSGIVNSGTRLFLDKFKPEMFKVLYSVIADISLVKPEEWLSRDVSYMEIPFFRRSDDVHIDDAFNVKYKGKEFGIEELRLVTITGTHEHRRYITEYSGIFIPLKLTHNINETIIVANRNFEYVDMSLPAYYTNNKKFDYYYTSCATNPEVAKTIINEQLIEKLMKIKEKANIVLCYHNDNIYIGIRKSVEDMFEVSLKNNIVNVDIYRELILQMKMIFDVIDFFIDEIE